MRINNYSGEIFTYKENNQVDLDALNKIASGSITGLIECSYKCENKHHCFIYKTDNCSSLNSIENVSFTTVVSILSTFKDLLRDLIDNNMYIYNIKLSREYIYESGERYGFIYIPLAKAKNMSPKKIYLKLLSVINCKDPRILELKKTIKKSKEGNNLIEIIDSYVSNLSENEIPFSSEDETTLLSNEETTFLNEDETTLLNNEETAVSNEDETTLLSNEETAVSNEDETTLLNNEETAVSNEDETTLLNNEETTVLSEGETTVLNTNNPSGQESIIDNRLFLVGTGNGVRIDIDHVPFTLGSEQNGVDYIISNESISRRHATVIFENGNYYIVDNNSTNGTTVEGVRLQPNERAEVGNGYIITLGNEHFQSHIESR